MKNFLLTLLENVFFQLQSNEVFSQAFDMINEIREESCESYLKMYTGNIFDPLISLDFSRSGATFNSFTSHHTGSSLHLTYATKSEEFYSGV